LQPILLRFGVMKKYGVTDYYQSDECDSGDSSETSALLKLYTFLLLMFQTLFRLSDTAINDWFQPFTHTQHSEGAI